MSAAVIKALSIARALLSDLIENSGQGIMKIAVGIIALIVFLLLFLMIPIIIFERVPVVKHEQALWYYDAARQVSDMTSSPCDDGVYVDWQEVIAIDALKHEQDFRKSSSKKAKDLARAFVEEDGSCEH